MPSDNLDDKISAAITKEVRRALRPRPRFGLIESKDGKKTIGFIHDAFSPNAIHFLAKPTPVSSGPPVKKKKQSLNLGGRPIGDAIDLHELSVLQGSKPNIIFAGLLGMPISSLTRIQSEGRASKKNKARIDKFRREKKQHQKPR